MLTFGELPVDAVIVSSVAKARTYYADHGDKVCLSLDGVSPCAQSKEPQAKKCAVCSHNQWGSRITRNGKRGKACSEYSQLWLLQPDEPSEKLSLRVPSASLRSFRDYEKQVTTRGEALNNVVTRIAATEEATRSLLTFRVIRFLEDGELNTLKNRSEEPVSKFDTTEGYTS